MKLYELTSNYRELQMMIEDGVIHQRWQTRYKQLKKAFRIKCKTQR
ncbi:Phage protein (plasmid) [Bacillus cereus F837/76]|nr:Phage protein [Bacillus cereus F837/76]